jgi:hypothetical protein
MTFFIFNYNRNFGRLIKQKIFFSLHKIIPLPLTISAWYGRFGNNIQQILIGLLYAQKNQYYFISPDHELIKSFNNKKNPSNKSYFKFKNQFFYYNSKKNRSSDVEVPYDFICQNINQIAIQYLLPNFKFSVKKKFSHETLVVHLRSGDIFDPKVPPDRFYVQNPLSYYKYLISMFKNTIIVAEPGLNPILNELKKIKSVTCFSGSIVEDFELLLRAQNLASSGVGTFSIAAALCSKNLKNLYCSNLYIKEHLNPEMIKNAKVNIIYLNNYIKIGEWARSKKQYELLMNYDFTFKLY